MKLSASLWGLALLLIFGIAPLRAAEPVYFPAKNQTRDEQDHDVTFCKGWAQEQVEKSRTAASNPEATAGQGATVRNAAVGAAIGGAVDGGGGAAKGAAAGAAIGVVKRRAAKRQAAAKKDAAVVDLYDRSMSACMSNRGYSVH